ncbi:MAG: hypothetical protein ACE5OY_06605 [Candidatus Bathyarchaeia archaeon]
MNITLLSTDEEVIAQGSDTGTISPGWAQQLKVDLTISPEDAARYSLDVSKPTLLMFIEFRSLFDLMGMGITVPIGMEVGGGG